MRKGIILILLILLPLSAFGESKASYVFRHGQPKEFVLEQTKNILDNYGFPIIRYESERGQIETDYHPIIRKVMPDFRVKYTILITEQTYGTRIDVSAITKKLETQDKDELPYTPSKRVEVKSAYWIIRVLVKTVGR